MTGEPTTRDDHVQRPVQRLLVHAGQIAAQDPDADQLHAAEEQHRDEDPELAARRSAHPPSVSDEHDRGRERR